MSSTTAKLQLPGAELSPRLSLALRVVLTLMCAVVIHLSTMVWGFPSRPFRAELDAIPVLPALLVCVLAAIVGFLLTWLLMRFVDRRPLREAGLIFRAQSLPLLLGALVITGGLVGLSVLAASFFGEPSSSTPASSSSQGIVLSLGLAWIGYALPQELLWRGYLMQTMRERPWLGVLISGNIYGFFALVTGALPLSTEHVLVAEVAGATGMFAAALAVMFRSIWPAVGASFGLVLGNDWLARLFPARLTPLLIVQIIVLLAATSVVYLCSRDSFVRELRFKN